MKTLKKMLALSLALLTILSVLSGCGSSTASPEDTSSTDETPNEASSPAADTGDAPAAADSDSPTLPIATDDPTLTMWLAFTNQYFPDGPAASISDWIYEKTGVHLECTPASSATATEQFNLMMVAGATDDLIANMNTYYSMGGEYAIDEGLIVDMTDYVEQYMPNYQAARNWGDEQTRGTMTDSGRIAYIYGLTQTEEAPFTGLMIRKDLLDAQGLALPQTISDWDNCLTVLHENYGGTLYIPANGIFTYSDFASAYGVGTSWYQIDGKVHYGVLEDAFKSYLTLLSDWYSRGLIHPDFTSLQLGDLFSEMGASDGIVALDTLWGFGGANNVARGMTSEMDLFYHGVQQPVVDAGTPSHIAFKSGNVKATAIAVSDAAEDPVLCARFLDYWYTEQGGLEWSYGPQGVTWDYDENGNVTMTEAFNAEVAANAAAGWTTAWENSLRSYVHFNVEIGWYHYERLLQQYDDLTTYDATCAVWAENNCDWNYPDLATMTASEQETYGRIYADAETMIAEYVANIIVGNTTVEQGHADLLRALESVNFQKCIDCKQAALDRYNAR